MKIKWLIGLLVFFLGVIFLSILVNRESQRVVSFSEKEILITEQQMAGTILPGRYSPPATLNSTARVPLVKSGITIIKSPVSVAQENSVRSAAKIETETAMSAASINIIPVSRAQDSPQTGITRVGKRPTTQEAEEMDSKGIVLY